MTKLRLVLFDLGGVACHFVPERRLAAFESGQYDQAIDIWKRFAVAGDVRTIESPKLSRKFRMISLQPLGVIIPHRRSTTDHYVSLAAAGL